jgi:arsenite methyltransferase
VTETDAALPAALGRALELFADPPTNPDVTKGYLDLLGTSFGKDSDVATNKGVIQSVWASSTGSMLYEHTQAITRTFLAGWQHPLEWLDIPEGGVALDVGCGPGIVTPSLARAAGPNGLALGVDISEAMLARAVRAAAGPEIGFLRADAQRLPLRDQTVDAIVSIAVILLVPDPVAALSEMARVLRPGGRLAVMIPTAGPASRLMRLLPDTGAREFGDDELGDILDDLGFASVRTKKSGFTQWVRAKR